MNLDTLKQKISVLKSKANDDFLSSVSKEDLDDSYRSFLGKKGEVNLLLKTLGSLPQEKNRFYTPWVSRFKRLHSSRNSNYQRDLRFL